MVSRGRVGVDTSSRVSLRETKWRDEIWVWRSRSVRRRLLVVVVVVVWSSVIAERSWDEREGEEEEFVSLLSDMVFSDCHARREGRK